jgi:hypothetical protein
MESSFQDEKPISENYPDQNQQPINPSSKPMIGGILLIIAGLLGIFTWSMALAVDSSMLQNVLPADSPISVETLQSILVMCGAIGCILSVFALAGGIVAVRRKAWGLAIAGSILGLFTIGPFFLASILSFIGLILIILSKKDFQ